MWLGAVLMIASSLGAAFATTVSAEPCLLSPASRQDLVYGSSHSFHLASPAYYDPWRTLRCRRRVHLCSLHGRNRPMVYTTADPSEGNLVSQSPQLSDATFATLVKPLTYSNSFSMSSLAPACLSPLFAHTLDKYGLRTTLQGWAIACGLMSCASLMYIRGRRRTVTSPVLSSNDDTSLEEAHGITFGFWSRPQFYIIVFSTATQGLGHFLPALYSPSYATSLGISPLNASLLITYFNLTCVIVQPLYGALAFVHTICP